MKIVFDAAKNAKNIRERGLSFERAAASGSSAFEKPINERSSVMKPNPELIDDDAPEWTDEMNRTAMTFDQLPPALQAKLRGRPKSADPKKVVTLRLHQSLIARYQAQGDDWRAKMEAVLVQGLG